MGPDTDEESIVLIGCLVDTVCNCMEPGNGPILGEGVIDQLESNWLTAIFCMRSARLQQQLRLCMRV